MPSKGRNKATEFLSRLRKRHFLRWCVILFTFSFFVVSVGIGGLYYGTKLKFSSHSSIFSSAYRFFRPSLNIIPHYVQGFLSNPETIIIDVKHMDLQKLAYRVDNAKKRGLITKEEKAETVNAILKYRNIKYNIKLRLRGTYLEHVRGDKWSFRVQVKDNKKLFGMSRFSLSSPETRSHIHEWIFQRVMQYEGLIYLRYKFVKLVLNGKNLGIYALEEFFHKNLIENNHLREGIIVKPIYEKIFIYQEKKVKSDPLLRKSYELLSNLLLAFKSKKLPASKVFDIEKTAKVFALAETFGGQHGHLAPNFVCYFNPVTALLERIGYDTNVARKIERYGGMVTSPNAAYHVKREFIKLLFDDQDFYRSYIQQLERVTDPNYMPAFLETIKDELESNLAILYKEYPYFDYFKRNFLGANIKYIRKQLLEDGFIKVNFLSHNNAKKINLYVDNLRDVSIQVIGLDIDGKIVFKPKTKTIIKSTLKDEPDLVRLYLSAKDKPTNYYFDNATLVYKVFGLEKTHQVKIAGISPELKASTESISKIFSSDLVKKESNIENFSFLNIDRINKVISISKGKYEIDKGLVIPPGYSFTLKSGVEISLINSATILSYSPVFFMGSKNEPIRIFSEDSTGQGIVVLNAKKKSRIENSIFNNLSAPDIFGWTMSGAVNFYQSDVEFDSIECSDNRNCDDCINIIRSEFKMTNSRFNNTFADGLDIDFCKGVVANTDFINTGNDAIDGSGSSLIAKNISLNKIGDKGFSCGEKSNFQIDNVNINNASISFASKDSSYIVANKINIHSSNIGFSVFQKKPEFGPALITVSNLKTNKVQIPYLIETRSRLILDGKIIKPNGDNIKDVLYE